MGKGRGRCTFGRLGDLLPGRDVDGFGEGGRPGSVVGILSLGFEKTNESEEETVWSRDGPGLRLGTTSQSTT